MVQVRQILYFQKIAELKSMNKAADALYITQSSLSHSIKNLEEELGVTLFERTNKGVILTPAGVKFNQYCGNIIEQLDILSRMFSEKQVEKLSVSIYPMLCDGQLAAAAYREFRDISPSYSLSLTEERLGGVIERVAKSESELGIIQYNQRQRQEVQKVLRQQKLDYTELSRGTWMAFVGKGSPLFEHSGTSVSELLAYPVVRSRDDYYSSLTSYLEIDGIPLQQFQRSIFVNDNVTKLQLLQQTDAFTFLSSWNCAAAEELGLHALPIENCGVDVSLGWIKRRQETLTAPAERFIELVIQTIQS